MCVVIMLSLLLGCSLIFGLTLYQKHKLTKGGIKKKYVSPSAEFIMFSDPAFAEKENADHV